MSRQNNELPMLRSTLCSMIKSFFESLTSEQVLLIITGNLDETTKAQMIDLFSNIIQSSSTASVNHFRKINAEVTPELVASSLGNTVTESFKDALGVTVAGQSRSAEALRDMISEEVLVSVQCSLSDSSIEHVPAPGRLEKMLKLTSKMIKAIKKRVFKPCKKREAEGSYKPSTLLAFMERTSLAPTIENSLDYSEENQFNFSDEIPLDVAEEIPLDVAEEIPLDVAEEIPLDVAKEIPLNITHNKFWCAPTTSKLEQGSPDDSLSSLQVNYIVASDQEDEDPSLYTMRQNAILLVVERLVSLTYSRSEVKSFMTDPGILVKRLMMKTLAVVEDITFDTSPKAIAGLENAVFKDLVKKYHGEVLVLAIMKTGSPALEKFIADAIRARLAPKKKCICVRRFFSAVRRAFGCCCCNGGKAVN